MSRKSTHRLTHNQSNCLAFIRNNGGTAFAVNPASVRAFDKLVSLGLVVVSVHSSKGLEADTIWILKPDLMPHPAALKKGRPDDLAQEMNLRYVALTRSKNRLVFIDETKAVEEAAKVVETAKEDLQKCSCGSSMNDLRDFFGPGIQGHISKCKDCGGEMHSGEDWAKCQNCGRGSQLLDPDPGAEAEAAEGAAPWPSNVETFGPNDWKADIRALLGKAYDRAPFDAYDLQCAIEAAIAKVPR